MAKGRLVLVDSTAEQAGHKLHPDVTGVAFFLHDITRSSACGAFFILMLTSLPRIVIFLMRVLVLLSWEFFHEKVTSVSALRLSSWDMDQ